MREGNFEGKKRKKKYTALGETHPAVEGEQGDIFLASDVDIVIVMRMFKDVWATTTHPFHFPLGVVVNKVGNEGSTLRYTLYGGGIALSRPIAA